MIEEYVTVHLKVFLPQVAAFVVPFAVLVIGPQPILSGVNVKAAVGIGFTQIVFTVSSFPQALVPVLNLILYTPGVVKLT